MVYWIFGYGSLIWKPPPHAVEQRSGYVKSVVRRFAQSSIDHRGTPEQPGRVVTVIEASDWVQLSGAESVSEGDDYVWGVAYRIEEAFSEEVRAYMEHREQNGYTSHEVTVYTIENGEEIPVVHGATIWIGRLDNPAFVGLEPLSDLANKIHKRIGPSGPNKDYLYKLAESVRTLYPHVRDDYLFELETAVRRLDSMS
ncbi:ChaC-like protein [Naematelia encephala]|uniref:glutathione-specific gamma-glutamylcyclotransferase n=1 Tax=Naematelia encephala TaxID=71784 RepID=A0A1Y2BID2_9TREE|nr:ChaC-like protein [Naematelia encephala]